MHHPKQMLEQSRSPWMGEPGANDAVDTAVALYVCLLPPGLKLFAWGLSSSVRSPWDVNIFGKTLSDAGCNPCPRPYCLVRGYADLDERHVATIAKALWTVPHDISPGSMQLCFC